MAVFDVKKKVIMEGNSPGKLVGFRKRTGAPPCHNNKFYLPLDAIFEHEGKRRVESGGLLRRKENPTFFTEAILKRLIGISDGFERSNGMMRMDNLADVPEFF